MRTIDFDSTEIYPLDASSPKEIHKVWIDPEVWETNIAGGEYINIQTGKPMTTFQAYLLEGIYETHRRRDGVYRSSAWEQFEENFMAVAMTSDYSGASFTKLALFQMFRNDLETQFPIKHEDFDDFHDNDWAILHWSYNGEQVILKVLGENCEPTKIARWFFIDTNYANFFNDIEEIEDQAEAHYLDAFFRDAYARSGQAANYKRIDIDTGETIIDLEGYKGERNTPLPAVYPVPTVGFQTYYEKVVYEHFKTDLDSLIWSYKMYLRNGWDAETNLESLYRILKQYDYLVIHNYTAEIEYKARGLTVVWALRYMGLFDLKTMDMDEPYNSEEYVGDWGRQLCKMLVDLVPPKRRDFIEFLIKEIDNVQLPEGILSYSQRMWIILNALYESYIGD